MNPDIRMFWRWALLILIWTVFIPVFVPRTVRLPRTRLCLFLILFFIKTRPMKLKG
jgi:hypothetical protein